MNVTDYTYLMNKPDALTEKQTDALGSVLNEFPYFQSARALRLKGLYNQNSFKYNYALKVTAAHTADRSVLFDFITSESFTSIQNEYYDQKLKDLLEIKVVDSEVISAEQFQKIPEARIDPIEQSILKSIKEATTVVFEPPVKSEEKPVEPELVIEQTIVIPTEEEILNSFKEVSEVEENTANSQPIIIPSEEEIFNSFQEVTQTEQKEEEPIITEEVIAAPSEEEILNAFKEVTEVEKETIEPVTEESIIIISEEKTSSFNEADEVEEKPTEPVSEQAILESIKEIEIDTFEKPLESEEKAIEPIIEQPIISPSEEEILNTFKEVEITEVENEAVEPVIEETIVTPSEEEILNTFKEVTEIEEKTTDIIIDQPIVTPVRSTPTFFEEVVDDEIPEVQVDPVEKSILVSIKEASTVVFEEAKTVEDTAEIEEPVKIEVSEDVKAAEESLEIGKPIDFTIKEKHSFQEWLQLSRTEPIDRTTDAPTQTENSEKKTTETTEIDNIEDEKKKKAEIINRFIKANPKISPIKPTMATPTVQFNINEEENSYLMTETLARVYLEQKKYTKAIQAYEILILKYPEKISFFADRISDIKILQQNNNNN